MPEISRKRTVFSAANPSTDTDNDPWAEFRAVEILDLHLEFRFGHSLGKLSRFFLELENRRLMATRCPSCGAVWMPPRVICPDDQTITEWTDLPGRGRLAAAVESAYTTGGRADQAAEPFVLGYVELDGATTLLLHRIRNFGDPAGLTAGRAMRVAWQDAPVAHPMELFWFELND